MPEPIDIPGAATERPPRDETTPKAKPRASRAKAPPTEPAPKQRTSADRKLADSLAGVYQMVGAGIVGIGQTRLMAGIASDNARAVAHGNRLTNMGVQTVNLSETAAEAWLDVADQNPKVKRALKRFSETSATAVLIGIHFQMLLPMLPFDPEALVAAAATPATNGATPGENGAGVGTP